MGDLQEGARLPRPVVRSGDGAPNGEVANAGDDLAKRCHVGTQAVTRGRWRELSDG